MLHTLKFGVVRTLMRVARLALSKCVIGRSSTPVSKSQTKASNLDYLEGVFGCHHTCAMSGEMPQDPEVTRMVM